MEESKILQNVILCANAIHLALENEQEFYQRYIVEGNHRAHNKSYADWSAAAAYFNQITGSQLNGECFKDLYDQVTTRL